MDSRMKKEPLIALRSVFKGFNTKSERVDILENADFTIRMGETIAVVGASGIGKSTLLNIIGTLDHPDRGELMYRGRNLLSFSGNELAGFRNKKIGFVFQFHHLISGFTTLENVMMPCMISRKGKSGVEKRASAVLEKVGLEKRLDYRIEDLSGGEQQRAALARALVNEPEILLADEPTGNLDRKNSDGVHQLIDELNRDLGATVVIVTHNTDLADLMRKRVTIMDGKIVSY